MYSNLHPGAAKDGEASKCNCETSVKRVSLQPQPPSKFLNEKLTTPRARCAIFVDEARALRYRKPCGKSGLDHYAAEAEVGISPLSSGYQKPWPSRKVAGVEELVKYMSSVPYYLQRIEKGENVQEKALNFGVIDWRRLEKWTSTQKMDIRNVVSSTMNKEELLSSFANQSCSYSGTSSSNNPAQRKQTSSIDHHWDQSADENSRCLSDPSISTSLPVGRLVGNNRDKCHKSTHEYRTSMQAEVGTSTGEEKSKSCEQQRSTVDVNFAYQRLGRNFLEVGDHLQGSGSRRSKTLSTIHGDKKTMGVRNSSSRRLPQKFSHQSSMTHQVPHSGFRSAMVQNDMSNMSVAALPMKNEVASSKFMMKEEVNQKVEGITGGRKEPLPKHPSDASLKWLNGVSSLKDASLRHRPKDTNSSYNSDDKGKCNSRGRQSPLRRILDPLLKPKNDSNSRRIASSPIHCTQEQRSTSRLLTGNECTSMNAHRSSDASDGSSTSQVPINPQGLLQDESYGVPMRQALVKLALKNGEPLFMFSANDNSVLVASMRRTSRGKDDFGSVYTIVTAQESKKKGGIWIGQSRNKKSNLLYDVIGRMEVSCSKLSFLDSKNLVVSKEFVLSVDEVLPSEGYVSSTHSSELAAIIVKSRFQKLNGSFYDALCRHPECENLTLDSSSSLHVESLRIEKDPEDSSTCSIAAILPSGIHGFPETGNPTSIIERWKSGGSCDCGGWDEGCKLTVLADRLHKMKVTDLVHEYPTLDEIHRIELFIEGAKGENKHAFSMITFKEGLYTVEFGSSLTSLQAFAICIATLHSKKSFGAMNYSAKHSLTSDLVLRAGKSLQDHLYDKYPRMNPIKSDGSPTSYVPHHPPISPVGRA